MEYSLRKWRMEDAEDLARALSNEKILNNLRDGLPYPYTKKDAQSAVSARSGRGTSTHAQRSLGIIWRRNIGAPA